MAAKKRSEVLTLFLRVLDIAQRVHEASTSIEQKQETLAWLETLCEVARRPGPAASLRSLLRDTLVEWNEGVGPDVETFWVQVRAAQLPIERTRDVVVETLARGRIKNIHEYGELESHFEALQTCGKITEEQAHALNAMLDAFETAPKNQRYFDDA